jgi:hypothetical protein
MKTASLRKMVAVAAGIGLVAGAALAEGDKVRQDNGNNYGATPRTGVMSVSLSGQGDQIRDRARDGSCQTLAAQLRDRSRDRDRDGSCKTAAIRQRDRNRDGSCRMTGIRQRVQRRDGSCKTR